MAGKEENIPKYVDLHTHSTASDGSMTPSGLVAHSRDSGLAAIAITDHDTVDGLDEGLETAERLHFEVIPGVEISVDFRGEMHILGYFAGRENYRGIAGMLKYMRRSRAERNPKIIEKLASLGIGITLDDLLDEANGSVPGRIHIARVLVRKGVVGDIDEAFAKYLAMGRPAYFRKDKLEPPEAIRAIVEAKGVPVLAHPRYLGISGEEELDSLVAELAGKGLAGIEAYYQANSPEETGLYLKLAMKHGILVTGGSDFHGANRENVKIGDCGFRCGDREGDSADMPAASGIPYVLLDALKVRLPQ